MRATTVSCVALSFALVACATPQNIKDKSAAGAGLYANLAAAHQSYVVAIREELMRRDRVEAAIAVRTGAKDVELERPLALPADTGQVLANLRLLGLQINASQDMYGVVDRFLRIDVVDADEVSTVTSRAADAFKEK